MQNNYEILFVASPHCGRVSVSVRLYALINAYSLSHPARGNYIPHQAGLPRQPQSQSQFQPNPCPAPTFLRATIIDSFALPCLAESRRFPFVDLIEIIAKMQIEWTTVDTGY